MDWNIELVEPTPALMWKPDPGTAYFNAKHRDGYNPNYRGPGDTNYGHGGVDLHAKRGNRANAVIEGDIGWAGYRSTNWAAGNVVDLIHTVPTGQWLYRYLHLDETLVETGDHVSQGDLIGRVGCTGQCTYPHIHFEARWLDRPYQHGVDSVRQGVCVDPLLFGLYGIYTPAPRPIAIPETMRKGEWAGKAAMLWRAYVLALGLGGRSWLRSKYFGSGLDKKTRRAQEILHVTVDGIVGPETWAAAHTKIDSILPK